MHYSRETYTHQQVPAGDNIVTIKAVTKEPVYETGRDLSQLIKRTMYLFSTYCMLGIVRDGLFTLACFFLNETLGKHSSVVIKVQVTRKWKVQVLVTQSCLTRCTPRDCSPTGSSAHGTLRQEYWSELPFDSPGGLLTLGVFMSLSLLHWQTGSLPLRLQVLVSCTGRRALYHWGSGEHTEVREALS